MILFTRKRNAERGSRRFFSPPPATSSCERPSYRGREHEVSEVYGNYVKNVTRTSPFVWAHRLEIPLVLCVGGTGLSLIAGYATGLALQDFHPNSLTALSSMDLIRTCFFILAFFCGLATLFWLVLVSRTLDLRYSLKASKYPIYSVIVIGSAIINAPPFVFSNVAWSYANHSRPLLVLENDAWGIFGLFVYLSVISIAVLFGLLIRRCNFHVPFLSFFICVSVLLSVLVYAIVFTPRYDNARSFVFLNMGWVVVVACVFATRPERFDKYQDVIFGVTLFTFSPASICSLYAMAAGNKMFPVLFTAKGDPSVTDDTTFLGVIFLFCVGLALNEFTFLIMRKARRFVS
jgi:hypothetical protein